MTAPISGLASRVRLLVDTIHDGSVNAAARDTGVAQSTLARIVAGDVKSPRMDAVQRIASWYGCDVNWLVTGSGQASDTALIVERLCSQIDKRAAERAAREKARVRAKYGPGA